MTGKTDHRRACAAQGGNTTRFGASVAVACLMLATSGLLGAAQGAVRHAAGTTRHGGRGSVRRPSVMASVPVHWNQHGLASWYGTNMQNGHATASGERFDPDALTAAHRQLPLGTRVRVHALGTGRSVVVRINDRGPYHGRRIIDLSAAAARQLGIITRGVSMVDIEPARDGHAQVASAMRQGRLY
ncbi:septal ring lytic transglycosylase RlpA family lipoprotein [Komagataeibacter xylinus]|uniref:Endolytic peptidoglycan transglycosylase RlpA n=1 Tax=Komagataeibacter xylinus TaxID=28448 RepID=A0A318PH20_KOMXY|nr:septal ring lytic transglycosylase RlpA family protein [Komagataeibacter xylinus]AZV39212.1 septal ring lytic transglycosylase RlpA family protein [Komagataeibacter xylinus]PYD56551.1 septal ring lytic transglycosylase RlpA family lipoprotein [Komagataeibacter xylinus]